MKAFIIYIESHAASKVYANECLASCKGKFEASLFEATTPSTLAEHTKGKDYHPIEPGRATDFYKRAVETQKFKLHDTKKSIFVTATRLWKKCVELDEPIVILEHDSLCERAWDNPEFEDVLILNGKSCWKQIPIGGKGQKDPKDGVQAYNSKLKYKFKNEFKNAYMMPGAAAYAIKPHAAKKLLEAADKYGWEQNDHFINSFNVKIQIVLPEYFTFKLPNLNTSHGF